MSQKQLYLSAMENNMKSCLNLQATPRGQQAETSQTSRLSSLLKRKGCRNANESIKIDTITSKSNNVIIDSVASKFIHNPEELNHTNSPKASHQKRYRYNDRNITNSNNNYPIKLIGFQVLALFAVTFVLVCCNAEPIPAGGSAILQANNNSGGTRSATTKALRGPPMNGSIFGKRSLTASNKQVRRISITSRNDDVTSSNGVKANDKIEEYNDVITDIIEDFLAKNADGKCCTWAWDLINFKAINKLRNNGRET